MTRAFTSAVKFDFLSAFRYNPLFFIIGIEIIYFLIEPLLKVKLNHRIENTIIVLTLLGLFMVWFIKQFLI